MSAKRPYARKTARVHIRATPAVRQKLEDLSKATGLAPAEIVRRLIERATPRMSGSFPSYPQQRREPRESAPRLAQRMSALVSLEDWAGVGSGVLLLRDLVAPLFYALDALLV